ncbi:hypothetical protein HW561_04720 [Rhodobacteraceae bacterium B1Z28]|uniref:Uncharacterized protein n=1 Tax=Ruegeria haliotis TaxID=2747601 RepID=A0ABX2PLU6_9RHOB|nr:hypothetical protein [Ruegeria haliotis]NVO55093.1 hypothetical protein [Ruegeria haliotis]
MKKFAIPLLIIANIAAAYGLWEREMKIRSLEATNTTLGERDAYGEACVRWLRETAKEEDEREGEFYLGRSWRKHGQLVFEVIGPRDDISAKRGDALCTYDKQSGMMYSYYGASKETWMFY